MIREKPPMTRGKPPTTRGKPPMIREKPPMTRGKPPMTRGKPPMIREKPPMIREKPPMTCGKPPSAKPAIVAGARRASAFILPASFEQNGIRTADIPMSICDIYKDGFCPCRLENPHWGGGGKEKVQSFADSDFPIGKCGR
jgi:hypothetical protein